MTQKRMRVKAVDVYDKYVGKSKKLNSNLNLEDYI